MTSNSSTGRQIRYPEYENFLEKLQQKGGPFKFVTNRKHFPIGSKVGTTPKTRSLQEIEKSVLESHRVKNVIAEEAIRRKCDPEEVRKESYQIIKEMAHQYNLFNIRSFGYFVCKAIEKLFDGIYVNEKQLQEIREKSKNDCVIFMPSHKTYFDFLLLSLICFLYDIQLPAIAAGMDFMSMKFIGEVLRRSGAFFMRRSFGNDQLYWAVFSEYVQSHVVNNDRTVEFFVEATRSRVGKSLHPKYGMLQMILEPYLRGSVYDLVIVPVSMNYDKILEEKLYAYELLGFPKPKESTSGLFKAREILNKKNGNCFITFGQPISVRNYFGTKLHRNTFVCQPDSQFVLDSQAKYSIRQFAHQIVNIHNKNAVITVWNLISLFMLQILDKNDQTIFKYHQIYQNVENLIRLFNRLNINIQIFQSLNYDLRYYIGLHKDLFEPFDLEQNDFQLKIIDFPVEKEKCGVPKNVMEKAISRLILTTYSNGMIHSVDSEGILCRILEKTSNLDESRKQFCWFHNLMKREFVIIPGELSQLFDATLNILIRSEIIQKTENKLEIIDPIAAQKLIKIIIPYFKHFEIVFNCSDLNLPIILDLNEFVRNVQKKISDLYIENKNVRLSFLSTEPIKNAFYSLIDLTVIRKTDAGFIVNNTNLFECRQRIEKFTSLEKSSKL